jgi:hypothetical protein
MKYLAAWLCLTICALDGSAAERSKAERVRASFSLDGRVIEARDAFAVVSNHYFGGRETAVEILYSPKAIPDEVKKDLLLGRESPYWQETGAAKLELFIDENNRVWMVILSVVVMGDDGRMQADTIAEGATAVDARGTFSFAGDRVLVTSKGTYDANAQRPGHYVWDVDTELPVIDIRKRSDSR